MTEQNHLSAFVSSIRARAERERREIVSEFEQLRMKQVDEERRLLMRERVHAIEAARMQAQQDAGRMLSGMVRDSAAAISKRQEEIRDEVFARVELRLKEFLATDAYMDFLRQSAKRLIAEFPAERFCISYAPEDAAKLDFLRELFPVETDFSEDVSIRLGGLKAVSSNGRKSVDDTLEVNMAEQKRRFAEIAGLNG